MTSKVVVSIRIAASPAHAFEVFTRNIADWWVHNDLFAFTPRSPGVMAFEEPNIDGAGGRLVEQLSNGKIFEIGSVTVWEPAHRLVMSWRQATFGPEHNTEVEVRFEPLGDGTRVTVEHRGWDTIPQQHLARHGFPLPLFLQRHGAYWRVLLTRFSGSPVITSPLPSGVAD